MSISDKNDRNETLPKERIQFNWMREVGTIGAFVCLFVLSLTLFLWILMLPTELGKKICS